MSNTSSLVTDLRGFMTALVTPFRAGAVDFDRLSALIDRQIEAGTDWLVPCGTTGESPTLSPQEHTEIITAVVRRCAGKCKVLAGTGTNNTRETIRRTQEAVALGVDAAMLVTPYYNRPTAEGLYRHFSAVADAVDVPIVLYNVPARTGVDLSNDVVVRLAAEYPHIAAVKHATGSVDGVTDLLTLCDVHVLCGDDALTWPLMALGAVGVISVIGNLVPRLMRSLVDAGAEADVKAARSWHGKVHDIARGLGRLGPNPVPIKTAMAMAGLIEEEFRLPLCPIDDQDRTALAALLRRHEIL